MGPIVYKGLQKTLENTAIESDFLTENWNMSALICVEIFWVLS